MFNSRQHSALRVNAIVIVCAAVMAMTGVLRTAWAAPACNGACCAPPANAMHHPSVKTAPMSACSADAGARCGLQDTALDGTAHLTAAVVHHTGKPGADGTAYPAAAQQLTLPPPVAAAPAVTTNTHLPGPPLYLSLAVLLR